MEWVIYWKMLLLYLDDMILIAPDFETHIQWLDEVLGRLTGSQSEAHTPISSLCGHIVK